MSDKKSKSKSKDKLEKAEKAEKPPKDAKSKKGKDQGAKDEAKSKKSGDKASKKPKAEKDQQGKPIQKVDLDLSQENFSDFLKNPFGFQPQAVLLDDALCCHHRQITTVFCESCEQAGCQSCLLYGPHNNQMHRMGKIEESFQARYLYLNELVCGDLLERRDKLNKYLEGLTQLSDELRYVKQGVQKITKHQFSEVMDRLRVSSGGKLAVLHHEMAELQRDLESINTLGNEFFQLTSFNPIVATGPQPVPTKGIVPFLLRSKFLQEQAEQLISKPIKATVEVYPYDLPRQLTERKLLFERNRGLLELLKLKDECIWQLTQQRKGMKGKLWADFNEEARGEIEEWDKLRGKIMQELEPLIMMCEKCGVQLNEGNVNQNCGRGDWHSFRK